MTQSVEPPIADLPEAFVNAFQGAQKSSDRYSIVNDFFEIHSIDESHTVVGNCFYYVFGPDDLSYLVFTSETPVSNGEVAMRFAIDGKPIKPVALAKFLKSCLRGKIVSLTPKWKVPTLTTPENAIEPERHSDAKSEAINAQPEIEKPSLDTNKRDLILDTGSFSQLIDAAQRSGIVPGIQSIIQLRDCEFRLGHYQEALNILESIFSSFNASASQRLQRLKREDTDIASGRTKISPKELQAKRVRDNMGTQVIERTRTRFARVLDGLRLLLRTEIEKNDAK